MSEAALPEMRLNSEALYREDVFTDRRVGSLRRLTPVTSSGEIDPDRAVLFEGSASLMTPSGALPLNFAIEAESLDEALTQFPDLAEKALIQTLDELKRLQRESQSSIVVPGQGPSGPGMPPGAMGGGKIQL